MRDSAGRSSARSVSWRASTSRPAHAEVKPPGTAGCLPDTWPSSSTRNARSAARAIQRRLRSAGAVSVHGPEMSRMKLFIQFLFMLSLVGGLGACASAQKWSSAGGNRDAGVVRVSYEYPEFRQPQVSDDQAQRVALGRCNAWGFRTAEPK